MIDFLVSIIYKIYYSVSGFFPARRAVKTPEVPSLEEILAEANFPDKPIPVEKIEIKESEEALKLIMELNRKERREKLKSFILNYMTPRCPRGLFNE